MISSIDDITLHGEGWDPTVKEFMGRVQKLCAKNGSLQDHKSGGAATQYPIQLARVTGHVIQLAATIGNWTASSALKMVKDDFYTFLQKDPAANIGIRKDNDRMPTITMGSALEVTSIIAYLQTDFARLCVSLLKTTQNLDTGELSMVPWMDFTRGWTDDDLFSNLGYYRGHPIREYARTFLPDYHNIYPNGKTY